jgi:hypothetical protein
VGAISDGMKAISLKVAMTVAAMLAAVLVAACSGIPQDGRYQTHDGGRSNFRA